MCSFRIDECHQEICRLYRNAKIYPYMATRGYLHNTYGRDHRWDVFHYEHPCTDPLKLVLMLFIHPDIRQEAWEIIWTRVGKSIPGRTGRYPIPRADLFCNLQVYGGTFARLGYRDLEWDSEIGRWTLPELSNITPLCRTTEYKQLYIETDGTYLWYQAGFMNVELLEKTRAQMGAQDWT